MVDFKSVKVIGLESSPVAEALAGSRANEARYFKNKYNQDFIVVPVAESEETLNWVSKILKEERNIVIAAKPLETVSLFPEGRKWVYVFYENGLSINVLYTLVVAIILALHFLLWGKIYRDWYGHLKGFKKGLLFITCILEEAVITVLFGIYVLSFGQ